MERNKWRFLVLSLCGALLCSYRTLGPFEQLSAFADQIESASPASEDRDTVSGQQAIDLVKAAAKKSGVNINDMVFTAVFQRNGTRRYQGKYVAIKYKDDSISVPETDKHPERHKKGFWLVSSVAKDKKPCATNGPECEWGIPQYFVDSKTGRVSGPAFVE